MHIQSKKATAAAAFTACYLIVGWSQFFLSISLEPFEPLFMPAIWALILPAPLLKIFHLAKQDWLLGASTNFAGIVFLLFFYSYLAYMVTKTIDRVVFGVKAESPRS